MLYDFQYFSLATLTTLGVGDVVPDNPQAKAIILLITLNGQLYLIFKDSGVLVFSNSNSSLKPKNTLKKAVFY